MKTLAVSLVAAACAFVAGAAYEYVPQAAPLERTVAVAWGDGKYGKAFYGAHVFVAGAASALAVRAVVYVDRPSGIGYVGHDCGELGRVASWEEAVARFGAPRWADDGLHIGDYFLPRASVEAHR